MAKEKDDEPKILTPGQIIKRSACDVQKVCGFLHDQFLDWQKNLYAEKMEDLKGNWTVNIKEADPVVMNLLRQKKSLNKGFNMFIGNFTGWKDWNLSIKSSNEIELIINVAPILAKERGADS